MRNLWDDGSTEETLEIPAATSKDVQPQQLP